MTHVGQGVTEEKNVEGIIRVSTNLEVLARIHFQKEH